ncbi:glycine betaine ABC transporter substrate-binding protein [Ornithinibacillus halotolerans]|uniref:Glycine/betaine ABC transporter substrate-binding protein n=1 Tax=Ornithinibacillus halotolerans TaxID=1274357 RepID=A0A916W8R6_9BACI|nr:glycine betaine ABC transporter substrate-binding protein [Ornithinibacillus halotolerans]GGA76182.1 glycine/betaine ABC transporter substrate-binding protein [Ornithinibacillus halotolerans]
MRLQSKVSILLFSIGLLLLLASCQSTSSDEKNNDQNSEIEINKIVGIEPGSGTMKIAQETVDAYNLDVELTPSSEPAMLTELKNALENEEPIVVTLWQPHWMFSEYDLKFLEDPKETLGASENIHTMVRHGLKDEKPSAYQLLDNFYWEVEDMNAVMAKFGQNDEVEPRDAAKEWIADNRDKVEPWIEGIEQVNGETVELAYVNWDTELSSTNVVALVLEELGYEVTLTPLDMGIAFQSLSQGEVDGMLIAWLPVGAASYAEQYKDKIVDLGPSLEGAQQGFVVPAYMDIDSIEDLPTK